MSVSLSIRKILGSELNATKIAVEVTEAILRIEKDAGEMAVEPRWDHIELKLGEEYDDFRTNGEVWADIRRPYLEITVPGERK